MSNGDCRACYKNVHAKRVRKEQPEKLKTYYSQNREKLLEQQRRHRAENPEQVRNRMRRQRLGENSVEHYNTQIKKQGNVCALCFELMSRPQQDHDHSCCSPVIGLTGRRRSISCGRCLRGLLCFACNGALGFVEQILLDNLRIITKDRWLLRAQKYLLFWKEKHAR